MVGLIDIQRRQEGWGASNSRHLSKMVVGRESDGSTRRDCDRYRQRQLKAGLYKTKNFDCPLQFEMCRKIKNFKGLSAGQWQMFARTRASAPFVLFVFSQFSRWHFFLLLFDVIKKSVGSLVSAGGGFQSFSPRSPLQGFFWYKRGKCFGSIWTLLQYFITFESNSCYFHCLRFVGGHKSESA